MTKKFPPPPPAKLNMLPMPVTTASRHVQMASVHRSPPQMGLRPITVPPPPLPKAWGSPAQGAKALIQRQVPTGSPRWHPSVAQRVAIVIPVSPKDAEFADRHGLAHERTNESCVFYIGEPNVRGRMEAQHAQYWYRAMDMDEYNQIKRSGYFPELDNYGGIATNFDYARSYITNDSAACVVVEFDTFETGGLFRRMEGMDVKVKAEGDGGTYGLGKTGTKKAGMSALSTEFNKHMDELGMRPKVVYFKARRI